MKLDRDFFTGEDTLKIGRELIGKVLFTQMGGRLTAGIITETEAYLGTTDKACHAYGEKKTKRNKVLYNSGGVAYIYLCYGMHHLFNVVTHQKDFPHAVLIRGIVPLSGRSFMAKRRDKSPILANHTSGPGTLTQALGITTAFNGIDLLGNRIWLEDQGIEIASSRINTTPRIGIDYAGTDAKLPYRFVVEKKYVNQLDQQ